MSRSFILAFIVVFAGLTSAYAQTTGLRNLYKPSDSKSRSISPENFTGEKGKGGMAIIDENANSRSRKLGQGWKVSPKINIKAGETFTLAEINDSGVINHIWMTPSGDARLMILRFYWDDEKEIDGKLYYTDFSGLYSGFHIIKDKTIDGFIDAIGQYRWHIEDPIRFEKDLKITIQSLAWREETYLPLEDDLASVAYWYQSEPHNPFPELPTNENLIIKRKK